jgi:hypothetical protein
MRKLSASIVFLFIISAIFTQCDKPPVSPRKNVYVTGIEFHNYSTDSSYSIAKLWVNGVPTDLSKKPDMAEPRSVTVSGKTVCIAGSTYFRDKPARATLWINNIPTYLGGNDAQAFSVSVSGKDVYVSGADYVNGVYTGVIWKNGVATYLNGNGSSYGKVFAVNKDVYATGVTQVNGVWEQTIFKNQQPLYTNLLPKTDELTSLFVSGSDVYTTGIVNTYTSNSAYVWKNGVPTQLQPTNALVSAVCVSGKNVYVAGATEKGCALWKNGVLFPMEQPVSWSEGFAVSVSGTDTYVAGIANVSKSEYHEVPALWKNGKLTLLPINSKSGFATSVYSE